MKKSLKIGVVAENQIEFENFISQRCFPNSESFVNHSFTFIPNIMSTNSLNLDLVLLANESMSELFKECRSLIR